MGARRWDDGKSGDDGGTRRAAAECDGCECGGMRRAATGCDDRVRGLWATAESDDCVWCVLGVREFEVYINARESSRNGDTTTGDDVRRQC